MKKMGNTRFGLFGVGATVTLLLTSFVLIAPTADASEPPMVNAWSPVGGGILVDTAIDVAFSELMNTTSVEQSLRYNDGES